MKKFIYIIAIALILTGCDDFLSTTPTNMAQLKTPKDIAALLVYAYPEYNHVWFTEVMSDNATDVGPTAPADDAAVRQSYYWEKVEILNQNTPDGYFFSCYTAIANANHALAAIEDIQATGTYAQSELDPYIGEALVARAFNHFMIVNLFAEHYSPDAANMPGIPYVTTVEDRPIMTYDQLSLQEVYDRIEQDLLTGMALIQDQAYNSREKWHFNKKAAYTFASRFYLYRGLSQPDETGLNDWDRVIQYANLALENNPEAFIRDWESVANLSFDAFGTEYSRSTNRANFLIFSTVSSATRAWAYRYTMDIDLMRSRANSTTPHPVDGTRWNYYLRQQAAGNSSYGCYSVFKFVEVFKRDGINANFGIPYFMYTPIVAEEAIFNLMEAYTMKENYREVINLFNIYYKYRIEDYDPSVHGVTNSIIQRKYGGVNADQFPDVNPHFSINDRQRVYLRCIVNVRASEFVSEGHRWFDIKRMHIQIRHRIYPNSYITLTPDDPRRVIPFPVDADQYMNKYNDNVQLVEKGSLQPQPYNLENNN